jgi:hypothetical protein
MPQDTQSSQGGGQAPATETGPAGLTTSTESAPASDAVAQAPEPGGFLVSAFLGALLAMVLVTLVTGLWDRFYTSKRRKMQEQKNKAASDSLKSGIGQLSDRVEQLMMKLQSVQEGHRSLSEQVLGIQTVLAAEVQGLRQQIDVSGHRVAEVKGVAEKVSSQVQAVQNNHAEELRQFKEHAERQQKSSEEQYLAEIERLSKQIGIAARVSSEHDLRNELVKARMDLNRAGAPEASVFFDALGVQLREIEKALDAPTQEAVERFTITLRAAEFDPHSVPSEFWGETVPARRLVEDLRAQALALLASRLNLKVDRPRVGSRFEAADYNSAGTIVASAQKQVDTVAAVVRVGLRRDDGRLALRPEVLRFVAGEATASEDFEALSAGPTGTPALTEASRASEQVPEEAGQLVLGEAGEAPVLGHTDVSLQDKLQERTRSEF